MTVNVTKEIREVNVQTYIATDGESFKSELECRRYEKQIEREEAYKAVIDLLVYENERAPIPCDGGENYESHIWEWYKVENDDQLERLNNYFDTNASVETFPEYICIERCDDGDDEGYSQTLTGCIDYVKRFFEDFGYKVDFIKK